LISRIRKLAGFVLVLWTGTVVLWWLGYTDSVNGFILQLAGTEASSAYQKDFIYRQWATGHGGVYVPVTDSNPPNPFLQAIPERDIITPSGRQLTLVNPAYMTRQVYELEREQLFRFNKITSLRLRNPLNAPDEWERKALELIEAGGGNVREVADLDGRPYLRFMGGMVATDGCLKCHYDQGYEVGDVIGGIAVAVDIAPYKEALEPLVARNNLLRIIVWLAGTIITLIIGYLASTRIRVRDRIHDALVQSEEKFNKAFQSSPDAVVILCVPGWAIMEANRRYSGVFLDADKDAGLAAHPFCSIWVDTGRLEAFQTEYNQKGVVSDFSADLVGVDGIKLHCLVSAETYIVETQTYAIVRIRDITHEVLAGKQIRTQLEENQTLLKELYHRTRNNLQVVASLLNLQTSYASIEEVKEALNRVRSRIEAISLVHQMMHESSNLSWIDLKAFMIALGQTVLGKDSASSRLVHYEVHGDTSLMLQDVVVPLGLAVNELLSNSVSHGLHDDGRCTVTIDINHDDAGRLVLVYTDDGPGLDPGINPEAPASLGLTIVYALITGQVGGELHISTGPGFICTIALPGF
jgi:two-component sensor histidine kinase/PAS domain-containing protein